MSPKDEETMENQSCIGFIWAIYTDLYWFIWYIIWFILMVYISLSMFILVYQRLISFDVGM